MRGLILILGESFRDGGQHCRRIGADRSFSGQIRAANSHIEFIKHLNSNYNCSIKTYLTSYTTKFDNELKDIYKDTLIDAEFLGERIGYANLITRTLTRVKPEDYDFILFLRNDIFLKERFLELFNPRWNTIRFPCISWITRSIHNGHPRVNDSFLFIPRKYYSYLKYSSNFPFFGHYLWANFVDKTNLTYKDLDMMIETYHDADSAKDFNPLYYIVNRPICNKWYSEGCIFDKNKFGPQKSINIKQTKCLRKECNFKQHSKIENNGGTHCCHKCKTVGGHGELCQRQKYIFN